MLRDNTELYRKYTEDQAFQDDLNGMIFKLTYRPNLEAESQQGELEMTGNYQAGWNEMVRLAADAARSHEFNPNSLRSPWQNSQEVIRGRHTVNQALEEGWRRAVSTRRSRRSITHEEEFRLRRFRDRLGLNQSSAHAQSTTQLNLISRRRPHGADPSRHHHCRRRRPPSETLSDALRKAGVRVGGIIHTGVWHHADHQHT